MTRKLTTEQFIKKARTVHGDCYGYSRSNYNGNTINLEIECYVHGFFWQVPKVHLRGGGCSKCASKINSIKQTKSTEQFIKDARKVHGDRYGYDQLNYKKDCENVTIECYVHGLFEQIANGHLNGHGCASCSSNKHKSLEQFIKEARLIHGYRYDYSKSVYVNVHTPVEIICHVHGSFWQSPANHLNFQGCSKCADKEVSKKLRKSLEQFIKEARLIHGYRYDYSLSIYETTRTPVEIICHIHGSFWQTPSHHLHRHQGCPKCSKSGIKLQLPGICYYIKFFYNNMWLYKIGITNRTVKERLGNINNGMKIITLKVWEYDETKYALLQEQQILKQYKGDLYRGNETKILRRVGVSEIFLRDVLNLDNI